MIRIVALDYMDCIVTALVKKPAPIKSCIWDTRTQVEAILFQIQWRRQPRLKLEQNFHVSFRNSFFSTFDQPSFCGTRIWQHRFGLVVFYNWPTTAERVRKKFVRKSCWRCYRVIQIWDRGPRFESFVRRSLQLLHKAFCRRFSLWAELQMSNSILWLSRKIVKKSFIVVVKVVFVVIVVIL